MKRILTLLIICILILSCSNNDAYFRMSDSFLKQLIQNNNIDSGTIMIYPYGDISFFPIGNSQLESELSPFFGNDVLNFIKVQSKISKEFAGDLRITSNQIHTEEVIQLQKECKENNLAYWDIFESRFDTLICISNPIFSIDKKYAFICFSIIANRQDGSNTCGIFENVNGEWKRIKSFNGSSS